MNISSRLKKLEKHISGSNVSEEELIAWLTANPYGAKQQENFHEWCARMPEHLVKPYAEYVGKHIGRGFLDIGKDWVSA